MTSKHISKDLFKRIIKRRDENTKALEKKEKGDFKVPRFTPLSEKKDHTADRAAPDTDA